MHTEMIMRKSIAVLLSALTLTLGAPIVGLAQAPTSTLRGQIVDAGGRGATAMRVELVSERLVVATTISTTDGHFSFAGLPAGNYVVRTNVNGQPTGVRVSVTSGQTAATALLVLPSVTSTSPAVVLAIVGPALGTILATTVTVVGNQLFVSAQKDADVEHVKELVAAANVFLQELAAQLPPPPPGSPPPFVFVPTVPVSGAS